MLSSRGSLDGHVCFEWPLNGRPTLDSRKADAQYILLAIPPAMKLADDFEISCCRDEKLTVTLDESELGLGLGL